ncbi:MAG: hypothetical protein AAB495_00990 [Patescibacteria group bacterium]
MIEHEPQETKDARFERVAEEIRGAGYRLHAKRHDVGGEDPKIYHTSEHPRALDARSEEMMETLGTSPRERSLVRMAIAWHDTTIQYDLSDQENSLATIRRHRGARIGDTPDGENGNEGQSARDLEKEMREANAASQEEVFSEEDIRTAMWAIEATYPDAKLGKDFRGMPFKEYPYYEVAVQRNPEIKVFLEKLEADGIDKGPLFLQPHLEEPLEAGLKVPKEVLIVALADLGAAGTEEYPTFAKEGDQEMRELYANLRNPSVFSELTSADGEAGQKNREAAAKAFLGWLESQSAFAVFQALRFEKVIHLLRKNEEITEEQELGLRKQFSHFEENAKIAAQRSKELKAEYEEKRMSLGEKAAFSRLAQELGY